MGKGCGLGILDSDGHDGLHYAIKNNDTLLVKLINQTKANSGLIIDLKDADGNTAVHHCVKSSDFGSFENTEILENLHQMGFNLNVANAFGQTPLDLSLNQSSGRMGNKLMELMGRFQTDFDQRIKTRKTSVPDVFPNCDFDYHKDSQLLLDEAEAKLAAELVQKGKEPSYVPVD